MPIPDSRLRHCGGMAVLSSIYALYRRPVRSFSCFSGCYHSSDLTFSTSVLGHNLSMVRLSFSLLLILLPAISYAEPLHIPLLRRAPATHDMDYYNAMANHLRGKYGISKPPSRRATSANINLTNQVRAAVIPYPLMILISFALSK